MKHSPDENGAINNCIDEDGMVLSGDEWFFEMHKKINEFALSHYPNGYDDWYNLLDFEGNVGETAALAVKYPFHLPCGLIYLCNLLKNQ